jgi:hypothetical protein
MNTLYVAQAAKEEADRLLQMARMFEAPSSNAVFAGCSQPAYPSVSGSARISELLKDSALLDSGQAMLWGSCTKRDDCSVGDMVSFTGFLKDGRIHLSQLHALSLK